MPNPRTLTTAESSSNTIADEKWIEDLAEAAPVAKRPKKAAKAKKIILSAEQRINCEKLLKKEGLYHLVMSLDKVQSGFTSEYIRGVIQSLFIQAEVNQPLNTVEQVFQQIAKLQSLQPPENNARALINIFDFAISSIKSLESSHECYMYSEIEGKWDEFKREIEGQIINNPSFQYNDQTTINLHKEKTTVFLNSVVIQASTTLKNVLRDDKPNCTSLAYLESNLYNFMGGKLLTPIQIKDYQQYHAYLLIIRQNITPERTHEKLCLMALAPMLRELEAVYLQDTREHALINEIKLQNKYKIQLGCREYSFTPSSQVKAQIL